MYSIYFGKFFISSIVGLKTLILGMALGAEALVLPLLNIIKLRTCVVITINQPNTQDTAMNLPIFRELDAGFGSNDKLRQL